MYDLKSYKKIIHTIIQTKNAGFDTLFQKGIYIPHIP
jgi:hypothetical protein